MDDFLWFTKNLSEFLVHVFGGDLIAKSEESALLKSQPFQLSIEKVIGVLAGATVSLHIQFINYFILTVDLVSHQMEIEIAAGAHQLGQIGLLKHATLNPQDVVR
jgi:hypothetical protein